MGINIKYNISISKEIVQNDIKRIINQVYKLLPTREQNKEWKKPLQNIIQELAGMKRLFLGQQEQSFFILLCKLEGMFELVQSIDFDLYRRTIFECLSLLNEIRNKII